MTTSAPPDLPTEEGDGGGEWTPPEPDPVLNTVTRRIAAAIHLHASLAEHVHERLVKVNPNGFAPNWRLINSRILARHSTQARLRRTTRDLHLFFVEIFLVLALFSGVLAFLFGYATPFRMTVYAVAVIVAAYLLSFYVVWNHYSMARNSALLVFMDDFVDAEPPPPIAQNIEDFLRTTEEQNVVLFSGKPFLGNGDLIHHWSVTIDRLPRDGDDADDAIPFTTDDVYKWLAAWIPASLDGAADLTTLVNDEDLPKTVDPPRKKDWPETKRSYAEAQDEGTDPDAAAPARPGPKSAPMAPTAYTGWRLYVMGDFAEEIPGLFQRGVLQEADGDQWTRYRRPRAMVHPSVFERFMDNPQPWAKPYLYVTLVNGNGQIAVTLLVRVEVRPSTIFYEVNILALRPLSAAFGDIWNIPQTLFTSRVTMFFTVAPRCFPLMLRSIKPSFYLALKPRRDREAARKRLVELGYSRAVDFGTQGSLREDVSRDNLGAHLFWMQEEQWFQALNRRSVDMLREFLRDHRAPMEDFEKQTDEILRLALERARELYSTKMPGA